MAYTLFKTFRSKPKKAHIVKDNLTLEQVREFFRLNASRFTSLDGFTAEEAIHTAESSEIIYYHAELMD